MPYTVQPGDTLYSLAQRFGITVRDILAANPQITDPSRIYPGQVLDIPLSPGQPGSTFRYVVQPGDTLYRIARRYQVSIESLRAANPQITNPNLIVPGQIIYIPYRTMNQYVIQPGDSLYKIAQAFGVELEALIAANPGIEPQNLQVGQVLNIPDPPPKDTVIPREDYGYDEMMQDIQALQARYPFIQVQTIGSSVQGRSIPALRIGTGPKEVHYNGSFHANEWITTVLLMKFIEEYAQAYAEGRNIGSFHIPQLYEETSLWVVPMVNPDGVELVQEGISPEDPRFEEVVAINGGSRDFSRWKANIRGVDLNDQFPANWEREVERRGVPGPAPRDYPGPSPLSEPESIAMANFTRAHDFRLVMAFHTQGQVIYWGYNNLEPEESAHIVQILASASGYQPIRTVESDAGYKDWFIQEWRRPGFTIEAGLGTNPLPISQFWDIWGQNIGLMLAGLKV